MKSNYLLTGVLSAACLLAGCAAPLGLIQLDNEWAQTYAAKLEVERQNPDAFLAVMTSSAQIEAKLADLSARAEKAGDAARAGDPATAVGLYRVAAAAAWKSGPARESQVPTIGDKGVDACAHLPKQDASQPRDCAFIRLVPQLALYDVKARELFALQGATIPADKLAGTLDLVASISGPPAGETASPGIMDRMLEVFGSTAPLPQSLRAYVAVNLTTEYCALTGMLGHFGFSNPSPDQMQRMRVLVGAATEKMKAAGVPTACPAG
jgi:hypothetical protein